MPLPAHLATLPLYASELVSHIPWDGQTDFYGHLAWARASTLVFWWVLLVYALWAGREIGRLWGGRLALAGIAYQPLLLGHASLATTDLPVAACLLALLYHFRQISRVESRWGWWRTMGLATLWFTLAGLSKANGIVCGGIGLVVIQTLRIMDAAGSAKFGTDWLGRLRSLGRNIPARSGGDWVRRRSRHSAGRALLRPVRGGAQPNPTTHGYLCGPHSESTDPGIHGVVPWLDAVVPERRVRPLRAGGPQSSRSRGHGSPEPSPLLDGSGEPSYGNPPLPNSGSQPDLGLPRASRLVLVRRLLLNHDRIQGQGLRNAFEFRTDGLGPVERGPFVVGQDFVGCRAD